MQLTPKKTLGVFGLVMINVIAVDSLRSLPFSAEYGFSLVFYYILAAITFFIPTALVAAELATGWPNKGGVYVWVREAFGERWGFFIIWIQWIYNVVWYPTILSFIAGTLAYLIDPKLANSKTYMLAVILITFWGSTIVNWFGMKISGVISTIGALIGTLIPMFFIILLGIVWLHQGHVNQITFSLKSFWPNLTSVNNLTFLTAVLFGLVGMEMSAVHADEVKNPGKAYPRAILYSGTIILLSLIFASLAIAIVVPQNTLNVVTGLVQAFAIFFNAYHLTWMGPVITLLIIIGGISSVAAWVIGPTKGLLVATHDGCAPPFLAKTNRHGVPTVILLLQAIIVTLLCAVFLLMPTVSSSYWVLTAMTAQLALIVYILLFVSAIYLRYKEPNVPRAYKIPGGNWVMWLVGVVGVFACIATIAIGFFPPSQIHVGKVLTYELILSIGMITFCVIPFILYAFRKPHWPLLHKKFTEKSK